MGVWGESLRWTNKRLNWSWLWFPSEKGAESCLHKEALDFGDGIWMEAIGQLPNIRVARYFTLRKEDLACEKTIRKLGIRHLSPRI